MICILTVEVFWESILTNLLFPIVDPSKMFFQPEDVSIEISKDLILWPYFIASEINNSFSLIPLLDLGPNAPLMPILFE